MRSSTSEGNAQELVQAIGAIAADHKLTKFFSHRFPVLFLKNNPLSHADAWTERAFDCSQQ